MSDHIAGNPVWGGMAVAKDRDTSTDILCSPGKVRGTQGGFSAIDGRKERKSRALTQPGTKQGWRKLGWGPKCTDRVQS